jgi:NADPH:quinone reductase-like Zn-dependent oxidoreductase
VRAAFITEWGAPDSLQVGEVPDLPVAPDGVLVRVRAAGVNPVDAKIRAGYLAGAFPHHFPLIPGWDAAGVVEQVGPAVTSFAPGDEVYGYCRRHELELGTYAEFVTVPEDYWALKPASLSFEQAGALPLVGLTAHQALEALSVAAGETLFVSGGSGGVGHAAVQLGVARGARVIASASARNQDFLRELGAEPVDYAGDGMPDGVADAAFDLFGGDGVEASFTALKPGGRLVTIAAPVEREGYETHYFFVRPSGAQLRELGRLADAGRLVPHVEEAFPLERAAEAHERIEQGHVRGKLVLSIA